MWTTRQEKNYDSEMKTTHFHVRERGHVNACKWVTSTSDRHEAGWWFVCLEMRWEDTASSVGRSQRPNIPAQRIDLRRLVKSCILSPALIYQCQSETPNRPKWLLVPCPWLSYIDGLMQRCDAIDCSLCHEGYRCQRSRDVCHLGCINVSHDWLPAIGCLWYVKE